ncbi:MAG: leucine--tRNA ligase [bacterium]|nr:leucine--tRNA ligase [bacterium]MDN5835665.1 leucine--tRNA ligase [bacterium]
MRRYNPSEIEPKWQDIWQESGRYRAVDNSEADKFYVSCMFPYPSGAGMHTGHAFEHAIVDTIARFQRAHGKNVMNPMGWDSFGLPAENYAIKTGVAPGVATKQNIANFKNQLKRMGTSIDWSRELNTSDPEYYRWTQWIFTKLYERGLAYQNESLQWWCPVDKTVLANEQVESGKCWRCGSEVIKKSMKQWFFSITDYADPLLEELDNLDWPNKIKTAQENWIGRSEGASIDFETDSSEDKITVFSTRPDTIFGATFLVLAPEHPLSLSLASREAADSVKDYVASAVKKTEIERQSDDKEKTGVFTGAYGINPANGEKMPIWVADYVLGGYGTGAVMAVPAHDERDNAFAQKYELPIVAVVENSSDSQAIITGEGSLVNSGAFNGRQTSDVREEIVSWLESRGVGKAEVTYKMRDWLISRQRYWGAPIPIIHCPEHGAVAVPESDLPVMLPEVEDFAPKGDGMSPLARQTDWVNTTCPSCGQPAKRETDVMDGYACSSWYLLRFTDPQDAEQAWKPELANYWAPVDYYVGGDHAVAHLLYVRFWTHVFHDMGLLDFKEPVKKLVYHGLIQAEDGTKMSKSKGNVVDPLDIIDQGYGADALRTFELFLGPINENSSWSSGGIAGIYRFLNRIWTLSQEYLEADYVQSKNDAAVRQLQHKTIKKVTDNYRRLSFNTAIAGLMEYVNELYKLKTDGFSDAAWREALETLCLLVSPVAPHIAAELWEQLRGETSIESAGWPTWDDKFLVSDTITIVVQINGKLRGTIEVATDADPDDVKQIAAELDNVQRHLTDGEIKKIIYVPKKLVNIVV